MLIIHLPVRLFCLGIIFSSIAGAGPIVGPILAATYFGWGPTWLWILIGAIFVGGVHDFGSTFMSLRCHGGRSIADVMKGLVGGRAGKLFLVFVLLALVYVIIVFLDLTASTFAKQPAVASASGWFILVAVLFGFLLRSDRFSLGNLALVFPLTFLGLLIGHYFTAPFMSKDIWISVTLIYCFCAAVLPVGLLLQPRDFKCRIFIRYIRSRNCGYAVCRRIFTITYLPRMGIGKVGYACSFSFYYCSLWSL